jgi:hypothetical protein
MELFIELDNNNDNFVDRKDLIKQYGRMTQIKGAAVDPIYECIKCKSPMEKILHDSNFKINEIVKINFKRTLDNKEYFKYAEKEA